MDKIKGNIFLVKSMVLLIGFCGFFKIIINFFKLCTQQLQGPIEDNVYWYRFLKSRHWTVTLKLGTAYDCS